MIRMNNTDQEWDDCDDPAYLTSTSTIGAIAEVAVKATILATVIVVTAPARGLLAVIKSITEMKG